MKSVGMAAVVGISGLSFSTPEPTISIKESKQIKFLTYAKRKPDYSKCPCPACQAGLPTKELHWMNLGPDIYNFSK